MVELKVSVIPDEFSLEFDEVCEYLQEKDVEYVELRQVWIGNICEVDQQTLDDAKDVINDCGLKVSSIAGPLLKCIPPSVNPEPKKATNYTENWKYNYSKFDHILNVAKFFDAKYIRVFAYQGENNKEHPWEVAPVSEWDNWEVYKDWSKAVNEFKRKAWEKGCMLVCENDSGFNTSIDHIERIGRDHCAPGFGMLLDTGNLGANYENGIMTPENLEKLGKYVQYIHAKGVKINADGQRSVSVVNGEDGICRWPEIIEYFKNMKKEDFLAPAPDRMFMSIETHMGKKNKWENSEKSMQNLIKLID